MVVRHRLRPFARANPSEGTIYSSVSRKRTVAPAIHRQEAIHRLYDNLHIIYERVPPDTRQ